MIISSHIGFVLYRFTLLTCWGSIIILVTTFLYVSPQYNCLVLFTDQSPLTTLYTSVNNEEKGKKQPKEDLNLKFY